MSALNREQALSVIEYARNLPPVPVDAILDRLEACVVQDPRLGAIRVRLEERDAIEQIPTHILADLDQLIMELAPDER